MSKWAVIISGGDLDEEVVLPVLGGEEIECLVGVDKGICFCYDHQIWPDDIVGDFDSTPPEILHFFEEHSRADIQRWNPVKDASDTELALRLLLERHYENILILGGIGSRVDHLWANVQCLKIAADAGATAFLQDKHNRIRVIQGQTILKREDAFGSYFSVFPLGGTVEDFNIRGAKYPLSHHTLRPNDSLCVSNEYASDRVEIDFPSGDVILMETKD